MSFEARYSDICDSCGERINPGDVIEYVVDEVAHVFCNEDASAERPRETCTECFIQKPCPCEDGQ